MKLLARIAMAVVLLSGIASAQSAKVDMQMGITKAVDAPSIATLAGAQVSEWTPIMSGSIRTSSQKDLVFGVSLVTSLMTDTTVRSSNYTKAEASAEATIEVQVLVDGVPAQPGTVTFDRRYQKLMAQFDGFSCQIAADGTLSGCKYQDEVLQLVQETSQAHAFFFGAANVGTGTHKIDVQARTTTTTLGESAAKAFIGKGSFTVEEVRLVNGPTEEIVIQ